MHQRELLSTHLLYTANAERSERNSVISKDQLAGSLAL